MVASKRGRGARNQAAKAKPTEEAAPAAAPEAVVEDAAAEAPADDNNGTEAMEQGDEAAADHTEEGDGTAVPEGESADAAEAADAEAADAEKKAEEEKVESGKVLIENLPATYLFGYQEKLKELFSKHGEIISVKRGPIIVTEMTTTPTLSAIVEFKNKDSLDKALSEDGCVLDGNLVSVCVESRSETAVLVGVPYEASTDYVRLLFSQCGGVAHIHEFSKTKYKILRVTFHDKESVEKALKLDRELRINGFLVTVTKYRDDDEQKAHNAITNKNKRQHSQQQSRNANASVGSSPNANAAGGASSRNNSFRARGASFNARGSFRGEHYGARGRGFPRGGGAFPRGGFAPVNTYMAPQGFMGRPGGFMDGQRPNKRLRQM